VCEVLEGAEGWIAIVEREAKGGVEKLWEDGGF